MIKLKGILLEGIKSYQGHSKEIEISFDISDFPQLESFGPIKQKVTVAMSNSSDQLFNLGEDIEKYSGLSQKDAFAYEETPQDAYVYGLVQSMNGGNDIFFWTNGPRLAGAAEKVGVWPAILEQISHEGLHLARNIIAKHILGNKYPEADWPSMGEQKNDLIAEEALTTALGMVVEQITNAFLEMAENYIPSLTKDVRILK
jgi:hypothetical protein